MNARARILLVLVVTVLLARPLFAAATSDASGKVEDAQGNPIPDVQVTFVNAADPNATYEVKTDKKGRFFISGLLYVAPGPGENWKVAIKAPGFIPLKIKVNSRTQTAVIASFESNLKPDGRPTTIPIRPLGEARIEFVMAPGEPPSATAVESPAPAGGAAPTSAKDPLALATEKLAAGDAAGAVALYEKAIAEKPDDPDRRLDVAKVLYKLERYEEAEVHAAKAAELAPERAGPNRVLANIYYKNDQFDKADAALAKERKNAPNDPAVLTLVAQLSEEMGRPDEAIGAYETLVGLNPQNVQAWLSLGSLYARKQQSAKSEAAYRKVIELDPANAAQTFYNIGAVLINQKSPSQADVRKAVDALRKAVELKPDYAAAHKELGYALLNLGELHEARAALEKYLQLDPKAKDAAQLRETLQGLPKPK